MRTTLFRQIACLSIPSFFFFSPVRATVKSWVREGDGVSFSLDAGTMYIRVCAPDIIEVKYSIQPRLQQRKSLVIDNSFSSSAPFSVSEVGNAVVIVTGRLRDCARHNAMTAEAARLQTAPGAVPAEPAIIGACKTAATAIFISDAEVVPTAMD